MNALALALLATMATPYIWITGQSVSTGTACAAPALSTTRYGLNCALVSNAPVDMPASGIWDVAALPWPCSAMVEYGWESSRTAIGGKFRQDASVDTILIHNGVGGYSYDQLKKGTAPWVTFSRMVEAAGARQLDAQYLGMVIIHGESNYSDSLATYMAHLEEWRTDGQAKLYASTSWRGTLHAYLSQPSSWTDAVFGLTTSGVPYAMVQVAHDHPELFTLVGGQYQYPYCDIHHPSNVGQRWLGGQIGKVMAWEYNHPGQQWKPVQPKTVSRVGAVITIDFDVPVTPLQFDTTTVNNPGNYGFSYTDDSSPPAISSVVLTDADTVTVTLASTPTGANKRIRYAYTSTVPSNAGPTSGPRGNLKDSDTSTWEGQALENWCVHFDEVVP